MDLSHSGTPNRHVLGFMGRGKYNTCSNTYNPRWRDHPKFSYAKPNNFQNYQQRNTPQAAPKKLGVPLEEIVKSLANTIQNLEQQISQIATSVSKLEIQGKFPS